MPVHMDLAVFTCRVSALGSGPRRHSGLAGVSSQGRGRTQNQTTDAKKGMCHSSEGCSPTRVYICPQTVATAGIKACMAIAPTPADSSQSLSKVGPIAHFIYFNKLVGSFPYQIHLPVMLRQLFRNGHLKKC